MLVFTDPVRSAHPVDLAEALPRGWALVYRHFGATDRFLVASALARLAHQRGFPLLIGGDPGLARRVGAHGVHWPERMFREARTQSHRFSINTMSAHAPTNLLGSHPKGIDARVLSTVFPSASPSASRPMGAPRFRTVCRNATIPTYGLGGITAETAGRISRFSGLAGVGAL